MDSDLALDQARQAVESGDRETGRRLLVSLLRANPKNAAAWLLLSQWVDSEEQRADCLRRAAALDPDEPGEALHVRPIRFVPGDQPASSPTAWPTERVGILEQPDDPPVPPSPRSIYQAKEQLRRQGRSIQGRSIRGYRYVMLSGGLLFTLLLGLILLMLLVTAVVPQAKEKMRPAEEPVLYTATLWCPPCAQAGTPIVLWEKAGDGVSRGTKVGELPHNTAVSVLAEKWSEAEELMYYRVSAGGQQGWVPESFFR